MDTFVFKVEHYIWFFLALLKTGDILSWDEVMPSPSNPSFFFSWNSLEHQSALVGAGDRK